MAEQAAAAAAVVVFATVVAAAATAPIKSNKCYFFANHEALRLT